MGKFIDLTGQRFGRLIVIEKAPNNKFGVVYWYCVCDCGNKTTTRANALKKGLAKSCGCLQKEIVGTYITKNRKKYPEGYKRLQRIYFAMKRRCYNKNDNRYYAYGALGVKVCDEWKNNSEIFYKWALESGYKEGLTIDRIDVNGNYEPSNCRWATTKEQGRNRKITRFVIFKGVKKSLGELAELYNVKYSVLIKRLKRNWELEKALTTPVRLHYQKCR